MLQLAIATFITFAVLLQFSALCCNNRAYYLPLISFLRHAGRAVFILYYTLYMYHGLFAAGPTKQNSQPLSALVYLLCTFCQYFIEQCACCWACEKYYLQYSTRWSITFSCIIFYGLSLFFLWFITLEENIEKKIVIFSLLYMSWCLHKNITML